MGGGSETISAQVIGLSTIWCFKKEKILENGKYIWYGM